MDSRLKFETFWAIATAEVLSDICSFHNCYWKCMQTLTEKNDET